MRNSQTSAREKNGSEIPGASKPAENRHERRKQTALGRNHVRTLRRMAGSSDNFWQLIEKAAANPGRDEHPFRALAYQAEKAGRISKAEAMKFGCRYGQ